MPSLLILCSHTQAQSFHSEAPILTLLSGTHSFKDPLVHTVAYALRPKGTRLCRVRDMCTLGLQQALTDTGANAPTPTLVNP